MNFYQQLQSNTEHARQSFLQAPIIQRCFNGDFNLNDYIAFLQQAYHHVKFTVPLLMATGAKLNEDKEWLREAIGEYIEEEMGHQEWILNDLAACGVDKEQARISQPAASDVYKRQFKYLTSHGALDQEHIVFFEGLMNKITDPKEQQMIIHSANMFYRLYGDIFRELTPEHGLEQVA